MQTQTDRVLISPLHIGKQADMKAALLHVEAVRVGWVYGWDTPSNYSPCSFGCSFHKVAVHLIQSPVPHNPAHCQTHIDCYLSRFTSKTVINHVVIKMFAIQFLYLLKRAQAEWSHSEDFEYFPF
jgi:hypothetical protein